MTEYIVRGDHDEDFGMSNLHWSDLLQPEGFECRVPDGFGDQHLRFEIEECTITLSPEPVGWQISIEGEASRDWTDQVAQAICRSLERVSGQKGKVTPI